jgi:CheY-like chemotaxis protein
MTGNVLLVDDDERFLRFLESALNEYQDRFRVLLAGDGVLAQEQLARHPIALVVTDLQMPRMDGLSLLAHVTEQYPDIPVIVLSASGSPESERLVTQGGAVGYLEKPFLVEALAEKVLSALARQEDGGTLHGVSSAMFLQLIRMEQRSCTIRLADRARGLRGTLFFLDGELIDARFGVLRGEPAAQELFAWRDVDLVIQSGCVGDHRRRIQRSLDAVLLDAMRAQDEAAEPASAAGSTPAAGEREAPVEGAVQRIRGRLAALLGPRWGSPDVRVDDSARELITAIGHLGRLFRLGRFQVAHFAGSRGPDTLVVATEPAVIVELHRKAPRDRILEALRES